MLDYIKNKLNITWDDEDIDKKILNIIEESKTSINNLCGTEFDFEKNKEARELLANRVRYSYNNALEHFESNFQNEILRMQLKAGIDKLDK